MSCLFFAIVKLFAAKKNNVISTQSRLILVIYPYHQFVMACQNENNGEFVEAAIDVNNPNKVDILLMQRIVERDTSAFEILYNDHAQAVFKVLLRIVKDSNVAEDLLQETFWQVWRKAEQFNGSGAIAGWLFRVARNKAIDHLRYHKVDKYAQVVDWETIQTLESQNMNSSPIKNRTYSTTVEDEVHTRLTKHALHHALAGIPADQCLCVKLAYFEGMTHREIADFVNVPLGTIKTRIQIGVEKLQRSLQAHSI